VLTHVIEPCEKSDEANDNQELVEPKSHKWHHFEDAVKEVAEEVPESVHVMC